MTQLRSVAAMATFICLVVACGGNETPGGSEATMNPLADDDCEAVGKHGMPDACEPQFGLDPTVCEQIEQTMMAENKADMASRCPQPTATPEPTPLPTPTTPEPTPTPSPFHCNVEQDCPGQPRRCRDGQSISWRGATPGNGEVCTCIEDDEWSSEPCEWGCVRGEGSCNPEPTPCVHEPPAGVYWCEGSADITVAWSDECVYSSSFPDGNRADSQATMRNNIASGWCRPAE